MKRNRISPRARELDTNLRRLSSKIREETLALFPDLAAARTRVGDEVDARGRWLLSFAALDQTKLSGGDRLNLRWDLLYFTGLYLGEPRPLEIVTEKHVTEWRQWVHAGLQQLLAGKAWRLSPRWVEPVLKIKDGHLTALDEPDLDLGNLLLDFEDQAWRVLRECCGSFRLCRTCSRSFIASRRQTYCGPRCSQTARTRRFRERHPGIAGQLRRMAYKRRQQAKSYPLVKIGTRKARSEPPN